MAIILDSYSPVGADMPFFTSPFSIAIVAIVAVFTWQIVHSIVAGVREIVKHRNEIELKQSLVARGMSADEIERIVHATNTEDRTKNSCCS